MKHKKAFTLVELLAVIALLIILAGILIPKLSGSNHKAEVTQCAGNLKRLGSAFHMYLLENDGYAPFNPLSGERHPTASGVTGDYFMSWECIYLLCPYLGDPDREKWNEGTLDVVRCPGNRCPLYDGHTDYNSNWSNRVAPQSWPTWTSVASSNRTSPYCSEKRQMVDYQYNVSLGGAFRIATPLPAFDTWFTTHSRAYPINYVMKVPSEAVIFADIQAFNVHPYNGAEKEEDRYVYGYYTGAVNANRWGGMPAELVKVVPAGTAAGDYVKYVRTNESVHNGQGINALFFDGHVEFLAGTAAANGNIYVYDDHMTWGISYPICLDEADPKNQIPGVHGFRKGTSFGWCIAHEWAKGEAKEKQNCFGTQGDPV